MSDKNVLHALFGCLMVAVSIGSLFAIEEPIRPSMIVLAIVVFVGGVMTLLASVSDPEQ